MTQMPTLAPAPPSTPAPLPPAAAATSSMTGKGGNETGHIELDARTEPRSLSVSHNVLLDQPNSRIVNRADASGLVSTSKDDINLKPPAISKDVIEWLSRERLSKNQMNMDLHQEIEQQRLELMLQRQISAARQLRLKNRLEGVIMRATIDGDTSERLLQSEVSGPNQTAMTTRLSTLPRY